MRAFAGLVVLLLCMNVLTNAPLVAAHAQVNPTPAPAQAMTTLQQFFKQGRVDQQHPHGKFQQPATDGAALPAPKDTGTAKPVPSAEPATMTDQAFVLDESFVLNRPAVPAGATVPAHKPQGVAAAMIPSGTAPLQTTGNDGRLEVVVPRGSFDLATAKLDDGSVPLGELTLQISQRHGHFIGDSIILGSYVLQVQDGQGKVVQGVVLKQPITIRYHYTSTELRQLGIDPSSLRLSWAEPLQAARAAAAKAQAQALTASPATTALSVPMRNDGTTQTLTATTTVIAGIMNLSGQPEIQSPPTPHLASVSGNSGQLSYGYPIAVAPGPGGFAPSLTLGYSSESTNERHSPRSPAGAVGDGWSLGLGSISMATYPSTSTAPGTWYFLSGVGGVSDRLVPDLSGGFYETEHVSHLRIQFTGSSWRIWDRSGTYYELGNSPDSQQYTTSGSTKTVFQWNVNKVLAPYNSTSQVKTMFVSYLQDSPDGGNTIRDVQLKQIVYGYATSTSAPSLTVTAGTVDFHYHMQSVPSGQGNWATAYSNNYNCSSAPPASTNLRCDDPQRFNTIDPPAVMSTMSLDSVTSYVGTDSTGSPAYQYSFSYQDTPYVTSYYDPYTQVQQAAAGGHRLLGITPTVYQNGTAHQRKGVQFGYTGALQNVYRDPSVSIGGGNVFSGQTFWWYLNQYQDLDTGVGATITYQRAFGNSHGTPYVTDGSGNVTDDRHDPLYCTIHANDQDTSKQCSGVYQHPEDYSWSVQVVTQMQALGKDSSDSNLALATTTYAYRLAVTNSQGWTCNPITGSGVPAGEADCVGDNWIPGYNGSQNLNKDQDYADYYHSDFRGFNVVYTTSPSQNLTADYYVSTEGWWKPQSDGGNYNSGVLYQHDVYWGTQLDDGNLLERAQTFYAGAPGPSGNPYGGLGTCNGTLNPTYFPCLVVAMGSRTTMYETSGISSSAPWVQTDNTYDDVHLSTGLVAGYHNLTQTVTTSSNAPTVTKKYSYQINDQTTGGVTYYDVDKVSHSEIDDANGHIWNCQDIAYDEGRASGVPAPSAGWPTTQTGYSDCNSSNKNNTVLRGYTGYDVYGNAVASVDPFGAANSSLYSGNGCSLNTAPAYLSTSWTTGTFTNCTFYSYNPSDTSNYYYEAVPYQQMTLNHITRQTYDKTQGDVLTSSTDMTGQTTGTGYGYDSNGNLTVKVSEPGEPGSYTTQSNTNSQCRSGSSTPCYEIDSNSSVYAGAVSRTYYDGMGRAVETRTPVDATHDTITFTVHDEANSKVFQSVPFRFPSNVTGWIDPNGATIDNDGSSVPAGTITVVDPLGRTMAVADPAVGSSAEPGLSCNGLGGTWTVCQGYNYGSPPSGDSNNYEYTVTHDANTHVTAGFTDELGRARYSFSYSQYDGSVNDNVTVKRETQYNVLGKPTVVIVTDLAPQAGQSITSVTATASYDDLGRLMSSSDPDRGTHSYTYDADGRVLTDGSGSRTIGTSYDLYGRVRCVQDAAPTTDGSGNCSGGAHPLVQDTYGTSYLQVPGTADYAYGRLTQSVSTTYYPDGTSSSTTQQFEHDQRGRLIAGNLQITVPSSWGLSSALPTYQETQSYNDLNQPMTTQTTAAGNPGYTFSQAYDSTTGMVTGLSNNSNGVANLVTQSVDRNGNVSAVNFQSNTGTALATDTFSYDGDLRPASTTAVWSGTSNTIYSGTRTYDPVGNVISTTTTQAAVAGQSGSGGSETQNFCYDEENRLVWAGNSGTQPGAGNGTCGSGTLSSGLNGANYSSNYAYTHLGQLWQGPLNGSGANQQYLYCDSTHPHQVTGLYPLGTSCAGRTGATYSSSYDSWGNVTTRGYNATSATLSYDVLDELVQWNAGASSQEWYVYDASGERALKRSTTSSGTSLTVYAFGLEEHVYSATGTNTSNTYYYSLGGRLIGKFDGTNTQYYLTDALGSVLSTFSNQASGAAVLGNQVYGPYGNQRYAKGNMGTSKGFTGQYNDATGLDYYNSRYYDPVVGRFLSADSAVNNLQGADPYDYVGGNPETNTDPTGKRAIAPDGSTAWTTPDGNRYVDQGDGGPTTLYPAGGGAPQVIEPAHPWVGNPFTPNFTGGQNNNDSGNNNNPCYASVSPSAADCMAEDVNLAGYARVTVNAPVKTNTTCFLFWCVQTPTYSPATFEYNVGLHDSMCMTNLLACADHGDSGKGLDESYNTGFCGDGLSFSAQTPVTTEQGKQAIGDLKKGEKVWAYNPKTKKMELQPIEHVWVNHDNDLVDLVLTSTTPAQKGKPEQQTNEVIHTNQKHPFLTTESGFVPVKDLHVGMHVVKADGSTGVITLWKVVPGTQVMYNLTVAQDHTYTVGLGQWVVHNRNCTAEELIEIQATLFRVRDDNRFFQFGTEFQHDGMPFRNDPPIRGLPPDGQLTEWVVPNYSSRLGRYVEGDRRLLYHPTKGYWFFPQHFEGPMIKVASLYFPLSDIGEVRTKLLAWQPQLRFPVYLP